MAGGFVTGSAGIVKRVSIALLALVGPGLLLLLGACSSGSSGGLVGAASPTVTPTATQTVSPTPIITAAASRMVIDSIGVDAPVIRMFLDPLNGQWTYYGPDEVAWIDGTGPVGSGRNSLFYGHLDWIDRGATFWRLKDMGVGDVVKIGLEDGSELVYKVTGTYFLEGSDPQVGELEAAVGGDTITLETCGGAWIRDPSKPYGGEYTHRRIVRAERFLPAPAAAGQVR